MKIGEVSQETYTGTTANVLHNLPSAQPRSNVFEFKNRNIVLSIAYLF